MVDVAGDAGLGVAEHVGDDADVDAEGEECGCGGVAGVVEADGADFGGGEDGAPLTPVGAFVDGVTVGLGEDEVVVVPGGAGLEAFGVLGDAVGAQCVDQRGG